jgi:hypothetical protein
MLGEPNAAARRTRRANTPALRLARRELRPQPARPVEALAHIIVDERRGLQVNQYDAIDTSAAVRTFVQCINTHKGVEYLSLATLDCWLYSARLMYRLPCVERAISTGVHFATQRFMEYFR